MTQGTVRVMQVRKSATNCSLLTIVTLTAADEALSGRSALVHSLPLQATELSP
jgi:hypothetical protein